MFPVSGALQLKASEHQGRRPIISASGAYSRLLSRVPGSSSRKPGKNRFQRPSALARSFSLSSRGIGWRPASTSRCHSTFAGRMWRSMNTCRFDCISSILGVGAKSMIFTVEGPALGRWRRPNRAIKPSSA